MATSSDDLVWKWVPFKGGWLPYTYRAELERLERRVADLEAENAAIAHRLLQDDIAGLCAVCHTHAADPGLMTCEQCRKEQLQAETVKTIMTGPTEHYIGWCPDCQDHRMYSQCRQVERDETCVYACRTCGAVVHELPPF